MSFKSRQTSLTNLSSVTDRMETFEPLALDRNDVFYQRPLPPKSYIHGYVIKVGAAIFVFASLCIQSYLLTTVSHLQSIIKDKDGIMNNIQHEKIKIDEFEAMLKKLEQKSESVSEHMEAFKQSVSTDVEDLKKMVHLQNTIVTNANHNLKELKNQMKLESEETKNLESTFQKVFLVDNRTQNNNSSIDKFSINPKALNDTDIDETSWKKVANFSFERINRIEHELDKMSKKTKQNSKLLQNAFINSNSRVFQNFSNNSSQDILADVDTLILDMKQDLEKLKFAMPGTYIITLSLAHA